MNRRLSSLILALTLVMSTIGTAQAHRVNGLDGLLLGSAGGALVGYAINRGPEGIIAGSVIGTTIGMLIDLGAERHHTVVIDRHRHHRPRPSFVYSSNWNRRYDIRDHRKHRRHHRGRDHDHRRFRR